MRRNILKLLGACAVLAAVNAYAMPSYADVTVRASIQSPANSLLSNGFDWLLDEIEKETSSRVKFERYYSGTLAKPADQLRATSTGLAGIAMVVPSYVPAQLPLANVGSNPALWRDAWAGSTAYSSLYEERPEMRAELDREGVELIGAIATPTYYPMFRKGEVDDIGQLNGKRIMTSGQIAVMLASMGAQIVNIPTPEGYEALQRGTVDGAVYGLTSARTYGIEDVVESVWRLPLGGLPLLVVMNKEVWNSISPEDQSTIKQVSEGYAKAFHEIYQIGGDNESLRIFEEAGVKIIDPDAASLAKLRESAKTIWDQWAAEQDRAGKPGRAIMDTFVRLADEAAEQNPFLQD